MGEENHSAGKAGANDNATQFSGKPEEHQEYSGHKFGIDLGDLNADPLPLERPSMMGLPTDKENDMAAINEPVLNLGRPLRVLQIAFTMDMRGAETALVQLLRQVDPKRFQMDFVTVKGESGFYDEEIHSFGSTLFPCTSPAKKMRFLWDLFWVLKKEGPFDIVHAHPYTLSGLIVMVAMLAGVPVRLVSAQTDKRHLFDDHPILRKFYIKTMRILIKSFATAGNAVSEASAECLFGEKWFTDGRWRLITSGIDLAPFSLKSEEAEKTRNALGVSADDIVIGHVGSFAPEKNHMFLLEIFESIKESTKNNKAAKLVLIGEGPLEEEIRESVKDRGLQDHVLFLGRRADVPELLHMMDLVIFPSLFEGLGRVPLEAQAVGTPCLLSEDTIPPEVDVIPDIILRAKLTDTVDIWAKKAQLLLEQKRMPIRESLDILKESDFNMENNAKAMFAFYEEHMFAVLPSNMKEV